MKFVRAYLRASTTDQDATRARAPLEAFAADRGLTIAAWYVENESGAKLARPELFRLLADSHRGDVILIEQVDRLSRLTAEDWERLKGEIASRHCRIVALDLPTSQCCSTCSPPSRARTTPTAAAGRRRASPGAVDGIEHPAGELVAVAF